MRSPWSGACSCGGGGWDSASSTKAGRPVGLLRTGMRSSCGSRPGGLVVALAGTRRVLDARNTLLRPARQRGQCPDPAEGAGTGTAGLRGLRDLRPDDPRTTGGVPQAALLGPEDHGLVQNAVSIATYGAILVAFSPLAVLGLAAAAAPAFVAETRLPDSPPLFSWRSPDVDAELPRGGRGKTTPR